MSISDYDDLRLFKSRDDHELSRKILLIEHNDPKVKRFELDGVGDLSEVASRRLGDIFGQNPNVKELSIWYLNLDVVRLGAGLQNNRFIQQLMLKGTDLQDRGKMTSLAQFLSYNLSLKDISLVACNLGPVGIKILSIPYRVAQKIFGIPRSK